MARILVIDDDESFSEMLAEFLRHHQFEVTCVDSVRAGRREVRENPPDLALVDWSLPDGSGLEVVKDLRDLLVPSLIITGHATVDRAVESFRARVEDFIVKPVALDEVKARIDDCLGPRSQLAKQSGEAEQGQGLDGLVGQSPPMTKVFEEIRAAAPSEASIMLLGRSGTGKEVAARAIHNLSRRREQPFLAVNCGAIARDLISSELFGHERGAFTGATAQHRGVFERADGGTLFLDEITEMPLDQQVTLLRVLETSTFRRVGGLKDLDSNVRIVAASNRSPAEAIKEGHLREDLYFRLSVFPIQLPTLIERRDDIPLLASYFANRLAKVYGDAKPLSDEAIAALKQYHWPGNVRELRNVLERAYILSSGSIGVEQVESSLATTLGHGAEAGRIQPGVTIREVERDLILKTLEHYDGDKPKTAESLGISLKTLYNRLNEYEVRDRTRSTNAHS